MYMRHGDKNLQLCPNLKLLPEFRDDQHLKCLPKCFICKGAGLISKHAMRMTYILFLAESNCFEYPNADKFGCLFCCKIYFKFQIPEKIDDSCSLICPYCKYPLLITDTAAEDAKFNLSIPELKKVARYWFRY